MFYCGSFCGALMWRHVLSDVIQNRLSMKKLLKPRLYWITYFWMFEAVFGVLACRAVNYTAEELRGNVTSDRAMYTFKSFCIIRDICANSLFLTISIPWKFEIQPKFIIPIAAILTIIFGRAFSVAVLIVFIYTIRSIIMNTRGYQVNSTVGSSKKTTFSRSNFQHVLFTII